MVDGDFVEDRLKWDEALADAEPRPVPGWVPHVIAFEPPPARDADAPVLRGEQRQSDRYVVARDVVVRREGQSWTGNMLNLSLGGARIELAEPTSLQIGDRIEVSFDIPTYEGHLGAVATVQWRVDQGVSTLGIQFATGFRAKATWALGRYLERLRREGARP